jgi:nucleoid DNA-binding protein
MNKWRKQAVCHPERVAAARGLCWPCYNHTPRTRRNLAHNPEKDIELEPSEPGVLKIDDLIRLVADLNQTSYIEGKKTVYAMLSTMIKALRNKEQIVIKGFGRWRVIVTKPSPRINIYTKVREMGKPRVFVHFNFSKDMKRILKECDSKYRIINGL